MWYEYFLASSCSISSTWSFRNSNDFLATSVNSLYESGKWSHCSLLSITFDKVSWVRIFNSPSFPSKWMIQPGLLAAIFWKKLPKYHGNDRRHYVCASFQCTAWYFNMAVTSGHSRNLRKLKWILQENCAPEERELFRIVFSICENGKLREKISVLRDA